MKARITGLLFVACMWAALFSLPLLLHRSPTPDRKRVLLHAEEVKQEAKPPKKVDPKAWDAFLAWEEEHSDVIWEDSQRLGDANQLLREQLDKIERKQHLDLAALRVEQVLNRVRELNRFLAVIEMIYAIAPEPPSDIDKERLTLKRQQLVKIIHPTNGDSARASDSLTRLIGVLEKDRQPDLKVAREATDRLAELNQSVSTFREQIAQPIGYYSLIEYLSKIELEQRKMTAWLNDRYLEGNRGPLIELLLKDKK